MNTWDRTRQDNKFRQKLQNVKSTLPKILHSTSSNISSSSSSAQKSRKANSYYTGNNSLYSNNYPSGNTTSNSNTNGSPKKLPQANLKATYKRQNNLKFILREFGLSQYLRKLYEIGYDDHNYMKIGLMSQKKFEELLFNLKIFPGHQVKMVKLYDYLRTLHLHSYPNTNVSNGITNKKPNTSYGGSRYPVTSIHTPSHSNAIMIQDKPKAVSANTQRKYYSNNNNNNHKIVNSFVNGDFNYGYYLNEYQNNDKKYNNYLQNVKSNNNNEFNIEPAKLEHIESNENYTRAIQSNNKNNNEEIDKMLKYYMKQLNEKLDESYDSVDDSSLSHINITNDNIIIDKKDFDTFGTGKNNSLAPLGIPLQKGKNNINQNEKKDIINDITTKHMNENNNKRGVKKLPSINNKKEETKKENEDQHKTNNTQQPQPKPENIIINKKEQIKHEDSIEQLISEDEDIQQEIKNEENNKEQVIQNQTKNISNKEKENENEIEQHYSEPEEQYIPEDEEFGDKNDNIYPQRDTEPNIPSRTLDNNNNILNQEIEETIEQPQYSKEQNVYDTLRLNKSADGEYLRQNMEQFDIEYMCRCLGLAIMKHIEEAKDKQHITDLIDTSSSKETFSFFNSIYNNKMDFIFNFFNKDNQIQNISNLDRIELECDSNSTQNKISFVNHFKQKKDEELLKKSVQKTIPRLHSDIGDLERDIRFIDEIFGGGNVKKKKNYQFLSEKTKNILNKELSYINEVDSEVTISKLNNSINNTQRSGENINNNNTTTNNKNENDDNIDNNIMVSENLLKQSNEEQQNYYEDNEEHSQNIIDNKFSSVGENEITNNLNKQEEIKEEVPQPIDETKETFPSGSIESNYVISASSISKLKSFFLKQSEVFDDDYLYSLQRIQSKKYVPSPDPQQIFEFCANIMCLTKMEKEVIIITLIYLERFIFNTGLLLTSRNWRRTIFTAMIIASKIWDDDSFENNHFAQVFTHLRIGEINLLERTFLELIGYKVHIKCSEYFKYFFIIKSIALKYNYTGTSLVRISVERMMKIQEYAYQMQKKTRKRFALNNSADF